MGNDVRNDEADEKKDPDARVERQTRENKNSRPFFFIETSQPPPSSSFLFPQAQFESILKDYVGRPSPLYHAERLTEHYGGAEVWLEREDLNHTGAHKINNSLGQVLLCLRMSKKRIIAETGAGQHGVATATVCAKFGLPCIIYMGEKRRKRSFFF